MAHTQKVAQAKRKAKLLKDELANISKRDSNLLCVSLLLGRKKLCLKSEKNKLQNMFRQCAFFSFPSSLEVLK